MIYYQDETITIRNMEPDDAQPLTDGEHAQGWHTDVGKFEMRLRDQAEGRAVALVAEVGGQPVGYINVYPDAKYGAFGGKGLPEIVDFGVLEPHRRRGIGGRLMDVAEQIAGEYADTVYLGVGLHNGYGSAQRMYVKRGYIPDGTGVWYQDRICDPYAPCVNDDDLVLYLSKKLK